MEDEIHYGKGVRTIFAGMAVVLAVGYTFMILAAFPSFQSMITGERVGNEATFDIIDESRVTLRAHDCDRTPAQLKGRDRSQCLRAFQELGAGYMSLAAPAQDDPEQVPPRNAELYQAKALDAYKRMYALDAKNDKTVEILASTYQQQNLNDRANELFRELSRRNPKNGDYMYAVAVTAQGANDTPGAIEAYNKFLKLAPDDPRLEDVKATIKTLKEGGGSTNSLDFGGSGGGLGGGAFGGGNIPINLG